jgi:hypothetical protein
MGRICELYTIDNGTIDKIHQDPAWGYEYIMNNYSSVDGPFHSEDTVFSTDKGWDVARYLIQKFLEAKGSEEHVLGEKHHDDFFNDELLLIRSDTVQAINSLLKDMQLEHISSFYNKQEIANNCYNGYWIVNNYDYVLDHVTTIKAAYRKAAAKGDGLVVKTG